MNVLRVMQGVLLVSLVPVNALAEPILAQASEVGGVATWSISWTDARGEPRTVHVRTNNQHIMRYDYVVDGESVVDDEAPGYGIGILANHGACGATNTLSGLSDYSAEAILSGPHHYIWQSTFLLAMCDHPDVTWRVTNQYLFTTGEDHFIQTVTYDSSDLPASEPIGEDMRGPYNQTTWPGGGDISGFGWGSEYKFITEGPIAAGDANVGGSVQVTWSWTEPNLIPYVWAWADPAAGGAVDREYGVVQNQPYAEQDFGGGYFGCGADCFATVPPLVGEALPAAWAMPSQMSSYDSNYRSGRVTWGQTYGTFENGHSNDTGSIPNMGDHFRPINAYSFTHVVGKYSDAGVLGRVRDTENAYASRLAASTGTVPVSGPRGPGDFVGPLVGSMPSYDWSNPGFDFIYRSWNVAADASVAEFTLQVSGGLEHPLFVVHDFDSDQPFVELDGTPLAPDVDYVASYDAVGKRLWIGLQQLLAAGTHEFVVRPLGDDVQPTAVTTASTTSTVSTGSSSTTASTTTTTAADSSTATGSGGSTASVTSSGSDTATSAAGSTPPAEDSGGCACRTEPAAESKVPAWPVWALLTLLGALARRSSRRQRSLVS